MLQEAAARGLKAGWEERRAICTPGPTNGSSFIYLHGQKPGPSETDARGPRPAEA